MVITFIIKPDCAYLSKVDGSYLAALLTGFLHGILLLDL